MYFTLIALAGMFILRKNGWAVSKRFFYFGPGFAVGVGPAIWGPSIAALIFLLIWRFHPNIFLEVIFGWLLGAYVAIPNCGLFNESSVPNAMRERHKFISARPLISYLVIAVWLAFLVHRFPRH